MNKRDFKAGIEAASRVIEEYRKLAEEKALSKIEIKTITLGGVKLYTVNDGRLWMADTFKKHEVEKNLLEEMKQGREDG